MRSRFESLGGAFVALSLTACEPRVAAPASAEAPGPSASAPVARASAAPSSSGAVSPAPAPPELRPGPVPKGFEAVSVLARIEGALVVADAHRVARVGPAGADGAPTLEWLDAKSLDHPMYGAMIVTEIHGRWPDAVDVELVTSSGRAPAPTMAALTGRKGTTTVTSAPGGGAGSILGRAKVGASSVTGTWTAWEGTRYFTYRGPHVPRPTARHEDHCKPGDFVYPIGTALFPSALSATGAGTMIAVGTLCNGWSGKPTAEVWDAKGASKLVDLSGWTKTAEAVRLLPGAGDELHALIDGVLLRHRDGAFEIVPGPDGKPVHDVFASKDGVLHVNAGGAIHRREGARWILVATLPFAGSFRSMEVGDDGTFWVRADGVRPLRASDGVAFRQGCATPFVHVSDVSAKAPPAYGFPASRKVLDAFEDGSLPLVEFSELGRRRLGVPVKDEAQGKKLVEHWRTKMSEDEPRLLCFAPTRPREIKRK